VILSIIYSYYIADEPDGPGYGIDPSILCDTYESIKKLDPYHPITLVLNCAHSAAYYSRCTDIVMADPYPIGLQHAVGCDECKGDVSDVSIRIQEVLATINYSKPFWIVPQSFGGVQHWIREPTPLEERAMTYLALIYGARGIQYYNGFPMSSALWSEVRKLGLEVAELLPALLTCESSVPIQCHPSFVHVGAWLNNDIMTILAVNSNNTPIVFEAKFLDRAYINVEASLPFEQDRKISIVNGHFHDFIDAYGTRCYRFEISSMNRWINSRSSEHPVLIEENNLIVNPSFELQSNVGIPDGYLLSVDISLGSSILTDSRTSIGGFHSLRMINGDALSVSSIHCFPASVRNTTKYQLSLWAKGKEISSFSLAFQDNEIPITNSWKPYVFDWIPSISGMYSIQVNVSGIGTVWIDDLKLVNVSEVSLL